MTALSPRSLDAAGCRWKFHADSLAEKNGSPLVRHTCMEEWRVAIALNVSVKALHLAPLEATNLSASPITSPVKKAIEDFPEILACITIGQIHKCISKVHIAVEVNGKINKVIETLETCSIKEFQESSAAEIVWDVFQHHGRQLLNLIISRA
jgi:hypothetical protein